jgi:hypothetical protein
LIPGIRQNRIGFLALGLIGAKSIWPQMGSQRSRFSGNDNLKHLFLCLESYWDKGGFAAHTTDDRSSGEKIPEEQIEKSFFGE